VGLVSAIFSIKLFDISPKAFSWIIGSNCGSLTSIIGLSTITLSPSRSISSIDDLDLTRMEWCFLLFIIGAFGFEMKKSPSPYSIYNNFNRIYLVMKGNYFATSPKYLWLLMTLTSKSWAGFLSFSLELLKDTRSSSTKTLNS